MAEMKRVKLTDDAKSRGLTSTYSWDGRQYSLSGNAEVSVNIEIAGAWIGADNHVTTA